MFEINLGKIKIYLYNKSMGYKLKFEELKKNMHFLTNI